MADFRAFLEGRNLITAKGQLPAACWFLLSERSCDELKATDTLAAGVGEIFGTGYSRRVEEVPASAESGNPQAVQFGPLAWRTGEAEDWSTEVRSVLMVSSEDNSGAAFCAWNILKGGRPPDLSFPCTTETFSCSLETR
jgi:hypothetical protein